MKNLIPRLAELEILGRRPEVCVLPSSPGDSDAHLAVTDRQYSSLLPITEKGNCICVSGGKQKKRTVKTEIPAFSFKGSNIKLQHVVMTDVQNFF